MDTLGRGFPHEKYLSALVKFLDTIHYHDAIRYHNANYSRSERQETLHHVYSKTAEHFMQPTQARELNIHPRRMTVILRTAVQIVVFAWVGLPTQVMVDICICFGYIIILDDKEDDPAPDMDSFAQDLLHGRQQRSTFWRLMNEHLSANLLPHYGSFCNLAIIRSILDYFHGCWIETHNFQGLKGSDGYPPFLRRLTAFGGFCGASLFPTALFDEKAFFEEITTVLAEIEPVMAWVNDLISFYKEFDTPRDQTTLIANVCHTEGISLEQAFDRLTNDLISSVDRLQSVFDAKKCPKLAQMMHTFVEGYTTSELCDERYRLRELYERPDDSSDGVRFRTYFEAAMEAGQFNFEDWSPSMPSVPLEGDRAARD